MTRPLGLLGTVGLLLAVTGCSLDSFSMAFWNNSRSDQVIAGAPQDVSLQIQSVLSGANIAVVERSQGDTIVLMGNTTKKQTFYLKLTKQKTDKGDATLVHVDWNGKDPDTRFYLDLMAAVTDPGRQAAMQRNRQGDLQTTSFQNTGR
jgi:hypothetical protein